MKIAIVCPIGDLQRFGYWRIAQPCLESWRALGDLFLIQSSRANPPFNIEGVYIRDERTLMRIVDGQEWFDHRLVADNANIGIATARAAGYDVAVTICVNWYIEQGTAELIHNCCAALRTAHRNYDFLYRRLQLGRRLFDSDRESIAVINIGQVDGDVVQVLADQIQIENKTICAARNNFTAHNAEAYIDCEFELTTDELREKLIDVRNYAEILPKRAGVDWEYWEHYYQERARQLNPSSDAPQTVGQHIIAAHPAGAFSDRLVNLASVHL